MQMSTENHLAKPLASATRVCLDCLSILLKIEIRVKILNVN